MPTAGKNTAQFYKTGLTGKVVNSTGSNSEETARTIPQAGLMFMQLDLSDLSSIKVFANAFLSTILVSCLVPRSYSKDRFETQSSINHPGYFYLTSLLTDTLNSSASSHVLIVGSSENSQFSDSAGIDFDNLNAEKIHSPANTYGQSKLANILHTKELQLRLMVKV
ncbi:hypothetical protein BD408DRAFT_429257 [Parasitella parasitica]|nr:hypothetical protein BD408DRAFT_429257 [Parasitella parasitica]